MKTAPLIAAYFALVALLFSAPLFLAPRHDCNAVAHWSCDATVRGGLEGAPNGFNRWQYRGDLKTLDGPKWKFDRRID